MYRSGLVDTLVTHANTNRVWPNFLDWSPPWLYASSVKNKNKTLKPGKLFDNANDCKPISPLFQLTNSVFVSYLCIPLWNNAEGYWFLMDTLRFDWKKREKKNA